MLSLHENILPCSTTVGHAVHCVDGLDETTMCQIRRLQHGHDIDIASIMAETFEARKEWIQFKRPPVKTIFAFFPPLKDILSPSVS